MALGWSSSPIPDTRAGLVATNLRPSDAALLIASGPSRAAAHLESWLQVRHVCPITGSIR